VTETAATATAMKVLETLGLHLASFPGMRGLIQSVHDVGLYTHVILGCWLVCSPSKILRLGSIL